MHLIQEYNKALYFVSRLFCCASDAHSFSAPSGCLPATALRSFLCRASVAHQQPRCAAFFVALQLPTSNRAAQLSLSRFRLPTSNRAAQLSLSRFSCPPATALRSFLCRASVAHQQPRCAAFFVALQLPTSNRAILKLLIGMAQSIKTKTQLFKLRFVNLNHHGLFDEFSRNIL